MSWLALLMGVSLALGLGLGPFLASFAAGTDVGPAALNIRTLDDQGERLPGATYAIDGMEGTFTSGVNGQVCITGLPTDSVWTVTQVGAPAGYELAQPSSQAVEVDDDGDCNSPDAVFVNGRSQAAESTPTPAPTPTPVASETPSSTPPTPRDDTLGGNPSPTPGVLLPDTAADEAPVARVPSVLLALLIVAVGGVTLVGSRLSARQRPL